MIKQFFYLLILCMLSLRGGQEELFQVPAYVKDIDDEVYQNVITQLLENDIFPVSNLEADGLPFKQSYAVVDIDEDGKEELIINYAGANSMAGTVYYIYDYERTTGEVYIEHMGWPGASFYDNGYVKEEYKNNKDVKRGLYMLSIPSNFVSKINLCEWGHVFKERNLNGGANPEVKEWAEEVTRQITSMHRQITRDYILTIEN